MLHQHHRSGEIFRSISAGILLVMGLTMSQGCQFKGGPADPGIEAGTSTNRAAAPWNYQVEAIRVFSGVRLTEDGQGQLMELRIELLDAMGDSMKGTGELRVELVRGVRSGETGSGSLLHGWDVSLATLDEQRRFYDPVTRTYQLRLRMNAAALAHANDLMLMVHYRDGDRSLGTQISINPAQAP